MKKFKTVKTEDYILTVTDEEIKEGDYYTLIVLNKVWIDKCKSKTKTHIQGTFSEPQPHINCKKIIAHQSLNNSPTLEGVPLFNSEYNKIN